jgi:predicted nuclease of predicted toxin-antitoxin system
MIKLRYLVDANLPYRFSIWKGDEYIHQFDIQFDAPDEKIWDYGKINNLTIITKDSDFSDRILLASPPPKVIHIRTGNMSMKDFHAFINEIWKDVLALSHENKLVSVFKDKIEAIH